MIREHKGERFCTNAAHAAMGPSACPECAARQTAAATDEQAWKLYCEETAGDMDVKDFWSELSPEVQNIYREKVIRAAADANRQAQKARNLGEMYGTGVPALLKAYRPHENILALANPPGTMAQTLKRRIFLDMDGVLADFERLQRELGAANGVERVSGDTLKITPGAFAAMHPIDGAIAGVKSLIGMGFDVWIASKPATGLPNTYSDKAAWIMRVFPELKRKIILTHDKGLLGDANDYLVDDRIHKANCKEFRGRLLHFGCEAGALDWGDLVDFFRTQEPTYLTFNVRVP